MEDVQRDDNSVKFYTGLPSLSCLLVLSYCKWHEVLGWKEQDTNGDISGINKTIIINNFLFCEYFFSYSVNGTLLIIVSSPGCIPVYHFFSDQH